VLDISANKFLLLHHRKLGQWFQPDWHCDSNSNVFDIAIKETKEESGMNQLRAVLPHTFDIDVHLIPANE
jgi:hypothetical protein